MSGSRNSWCKWPTFAALVDLSLSLREGTGSRHVGKSLGFSCLGMLLQRKGRHRQQLKSHNLFSILFMQGGKVSAFARSVAAHVRALADPHRAVWDPAAAEVRMLLTTWLEIVSTWGWLKGGGYFVFI